MSDLLGDVAPAVPTHYRVVSLTAENIKRLEVVEIRPVGDVVEITGKNRQGKQQPVSEPVLTPDGWRPMGSLAAGDFVIGSDGRATRVEAVYPQSERATYRITMADGAATRCGPDHLWTVSSWRSRDGASTRVTETLSTTQLMELGLRNGSSRRWSVPTVSPVELADPGQEVPISPYALGVILGDGHIEPTGYVTIDSDHEILEALGVPGWRGERELGTGFWSRPLRHLGLAGKLSFEKFIPDIYHRASVTDRMALFLGLMDTDGTPEESWASYCTTSEALADDFVSLGSSLGYICKKRTGATKKYRYEGELKEGRMAWNIGVKSADPPFSLERKHSRWSTSERSPEPRRFIDTIRRVEDEDSVCIRVAAPDGLYVTKDFILTHNTSVLDAMWWTLAGTRTMQTEPIRRGADHAYCELDLGPLIVRRNMSRGEGGITTSLSVRTREGAEYRRPQATIDTFFNSLSLDPLHFMRMDGKDKFALLRGFVTGIDFDAAERANAADYAKRRDLNARARQARSMLARLPVPDETDLPDQPIDLDALTGELEQAGRENAETETRRARREGVEQRIEQLGAAVTDLDLRIARLREEITGCEETRRQTEENIDALRQRLAEAPPLPELTDTAPLRARIDVARSVNATISAAQQRREATEEAERIEAEAEALTKAMADRNADIDVKMAEAEMPVPGLALKPDGTVWLNDFPLDQASDAEQLRTSIELAIALNPKLRVIRVRDGSLLDEDAMALIRTMARERDFQIWVERVTNDDAAGFELVAGRVRRPQPAVAS